MSGAAPTGTPTAPPIRVYIAGPYTADTPAGVQVNVDRAIVAFNRLADAGFLAYCPHLSHWPHLQQARSWEWWLAFDLEWLAVCHAVLRLPGASPGADVECRAAAELRRIPVFREIDDLAEAFGVSARLRQGAATGK